MSVLSSFSQLVNEITSRAVLLQEPQDDRTDLGYLFIRALRKSVHEVQKGASTDDFPELTVINLIMMGAAEGYSAAEMRDFIVQLKSDQVEE